MTRRGTKEYRSWANMKQRVRRDRNYLHVRICDEWQEFDSFYADMGECQEGYSLDRINPYGNYEPGNCRWIPLHNQGKTTRKYVDGGPCTDCGEGRGTRKGLCHRCNEYRRRNNGLPRPSDEEVKQRQRIAVAKVHNKPVRQETKDGELIKIWGSARDAEGSYGLSNGSIGHAISGRVRFCRGFRWSFASSTTDNNRKSDSIVTCQPELLLTL